MTRRRLDATSRHSVPRSVPSPLSLWPTLDPVESPPDRPGLDPSTPQGVAVGASRLRSLPSTGPSSTPVGDSNLCTRTVVGHPFYDSIENFPTPLCYIVTLSRTVPPLSTHPFPLYRVFVLVQSQGPPSLPSSKETSIYSFSRDSMGRPILRLSPRSLPMTPCPEVSVDLLELYSGPSIVDFGDSTCAPPPSRPPVRTPRTLRGCGSSVSSLLWDEFGSCFTPPRPGKVGPGPPRLRPRSS